MINFIKMRPYPNAYESVALLTFVAIVYFESGVNTLSLLLILYFIAGGFYLKVYTQGFKAHYQAIINHRYLLHTNRTITDQLDKQSLKLDKLMREVRDMRNGANTASTDRIFAEWDKSEHENRMHEKESRKDEDKDLREQYEREIF